MGKCDGETGENPGLTKVGERLKVKKKNCSWKLYPFLRISSNPCPSPFVAGGVR